MSSILDAVASAEAPRSIASWKTRVVPALLAAMMGVGLVYGMGFVDIPAVHNAAHDGRHAAGFPCH